MPKEMTLDVTASWDQAFVSANKASERGLLLQIKAPISTESEKIKPLNLALVIDASGSMTGDRLEAAKQAAVGIIDQLSDGDRLSVISFSSDIQVHIDGVFMGKTDSRKLIYEIDLIHPRGNTNLGGGWLRGAEAVASFIDKVNFNDGNVVVLSDGMANVGVLDPKVLAEHASQLLARGITSSCVGIGDGYSPLQLDAIAEAGGGRLHESSTPDQIVDVLLGELSALREAVASSVEVELVFSVATKTEVLTKLPTEQKENRIKVRLGEIGLGGQRDSAFLVHVPASVIGDQYRFEYRVHWVDPKSGEPYTSSWKTAQISAIDPLQYQKRSHERDVVIANRIILLWQSSLVNEAVGLNDGGHYKEAGFLIEQNIQRMRNFVTGLANGDELMNKILLLKDKVEAPWHDERSKRDSFVASKKMMKSEKNYSSNSSDDWRDIK